MKQASDVDQYLANTAPEFQSKLEAVRAAIREVAPTAEEKISYGMPFYEYKGRLAYFALLKYSIGLYIPPPIIESHKSELKVYRTTKSAVQFPLDEELPIDLIKKLVKARVSWNEEKQQD